MTARWNESHHALYEQCREREQREASPTAAIIDSQSVKSAEVIGRRRLNSWGSIGVGRSPPNRQYEWHEKSGTKKGSTMN